MKKSRKNNSKKLNKKNKMRGGSDSSLSKLMRNNPEATRGILGPNIQRIKDLGNLKNLGDEITELIKPIVNSSANNSNVREILFGDVGKEEYKALKKTLKKEEKKTLITTIRGKINKEPLTNDEYKEIKNLLKQYIKALKFINNKLKINLKGEKSLKKKKKSPKKKSLKKKEKEKEKESLIKEKRFFILHNPDPYLGFSHNKEFILASDFNNNYSSNNYSSNNSSSNNSGINL